MSDAGTRLFDEALIARRRLQKWAGVAAAALVVLRLYAEFAPTLRRPDLVLLDYWQSLRGTDRPSPQLAIVAIDEKSIQHFGPLAWPRNEYVRLIERLAAAGARMIGFDFTFGALEREAANNTLLAAAMKKAGNVVFGYEFTGVGDPSPPGAPASDVIQANALARFASAAIPPAPGLIEPERVLAEAAAALGHVRTVESEDGRIRLLPLVIQHGDKAYPSLALQMARVYTETPLQQIELKHGVLSMGEWDIPVSGSGEVLLAWPIAGEKAFPLYSFWDVVRGDVPAEAFRGKAVLVAGTADGLDDRDFPFAVEAPGVLMHATFLDNVFRFDFVQAPVWAWLLEWGLFFAVCGLCVWLLPRLSTPLLLAAVPVLALLFVGGAGFLFVQKGIWVKVVYPSLALVLPLGVMVALRLTASERETRDVAAENIENQKLLGLSFQEKGMLDMALSTFNKLPLTRDMKLVYVNLGRDYENRGQRDRAFIAYKKVFEIDPAFEGVAQRLERLSQAGVGTGLFPTPTSHLAAQTPAPGSQAHDMAEQATAVLPATEIAAQGSPTDPTRRPAPTVVGAAGTLVGPAPGGPVGPGARFGRYEVERHLGRGGMGEVYLVRDTVIDRKAALKTIRVDVELGAAAAIEVRQRFYREAQTAGKLTHPNIVTVYDVGEDLGVSYIVMEFVEGHTLTQLMKRSPLTVPQIKHVIYNAGVGLDYAHQNGVFHRDVKPDNIMISKGGVVKVMDFGIARVVESELTRTGSVIGTPSYMSPEQFSGEKIDARSDIFSLGVILYELLTGKKPFTGETVSSLMFAIIQMHPAQPSTLDAKIPAAWDEILGKALDKNREKRYATAKELAQAVRDAPGR